MPLASPFDFTQTATARRKMLGLPLLEIPSDYSGSPTIRGGANFWPDHTLQWATIYPNWYYPQMLKAQAHGANVVRLFASLDGVLLGNYSQSFF